MSSSDRRHFADWLLESPIHVREYLAVEVTWRLLSDALSCTDFDPGACNDAAAPSVVPLRRISH